MTIYHAAAVFKTVTWTLSIVAIGIFTLDPTVEVAIIVAIPPTISAFMWGWVNHKKISTVEVNTNSTLMALRNQITALLAELKEVRSRADRAEGRAEGDRDRKRESKANQIQKP